MNIDPEQLRAEIDALVAQLPDTADAEHDLSLAELEEIARRLSEAHDVLLQALEFAELIGAGKVSIDGMPARKPGTAVAGTAALTVAGDAERGWVSRGAHKLIGALDAFGIPVAGRRCLDAGASTGGFTEVLLDRGAAEVVAADVGYGQLAWSLRSDARVIVVERTNARKLSPEAIGGLVDLVVADLSFISLATVMPALIG